MPIVALPQTTVRAIGSTSVISDPCSVVKELMDNAIDSSASSLQIEISQNTLDVIQLKDNGHGIPIEDHANVCKHAFTSKIETVDDLKNVGGTSFGFRGEALASVAEVAGGVTITTRTTTEVTATCLKYGRDGTHTSSTRTSHPVGTTVRITDFFKYVPVRRQTSLKCASRTLSELKRLMQAYAFAQTSRRFSLKVLKAKNESNNWMYAPSAEGNLADAALKIAGREVATSCVLKECSSDLPQDPNSGIQSRYELVALLPKEALDIPKVNNMGQYISIDGRPLSVSTGTGETITKLFKSYVRAAASKPEIAQKVTDPFCCLQLKCPQGAYDVNIEPGKDDVLFGDRETVFGLIEKLFIAQYGPLLGRQEQSPTKQRMSTNGKHDGSDQFELLLSRRRPEEPLPSQYVRTDCEESTLASPISQRATTRAVSLSPESSRALVVEQNTAVDTSFSTGRETRYINPWSISRINASFQTPQRPHNTHPTPQITSRDTPEMARPRESSHRLAYHSSPESPELLSPPASALTRGSPPSHQVTSRVSRRSPPDVDHSANRSRRAARERDKERYGNGALDTWFQRTTGALLHQESVESPTEPGENTPSLSVLAQERFQDPPISEASAAATDIVSFDSSTRTTNKEDAPTFGREKHAALSAHGEIEESMDSGRGFPVLERWAASLHNNFNPDTQTGLDKALDFERRKKEANQRHRTRPDTVDHNVDAAERSGSSPHRNRYLAAKAALHAEKRVAKETMSRPAISPHDPRAYLMGHQADGQDSEPVKNGSNLRRLHSSKLPFERIPEGHDIHDISLSLPANLSLISITSHLIPHDSFTQHGMSTDAFLTTDMDSILPFWNRRLAALIQQHFKTDDRSQLPEWQVELGPIVARHTAQFNLS